jgi:hypothetical protein
MVTWLFTSIQVSTHPDQYLTDGSRSKVVQSSTQYGTRRFAVIFENCYPENGKR